MLVYFNFSVLHTVKTDFTRIVLDEREIEMEQSLLLCVFAFVKLVSQNRPWLCQK